MYLRNKITTAIAIFIISYIVFLFLWIPAKPFYGKIIGIISAEMAAITTGVEIKKSQFDQEKIKVTFTLPYLIYGEKRIKGVEIDTMIGISSFAFNIPLTFSLIFALLPLIKWKKINLIEAISILVIIHILFAYSYFCTHIFYSLAKTGVRSLTSTKQMFWEFLWTFTDNMIIRFEPFLLSAYIWLRNAKGFESLYK